MIRTPRPPDSREAGHGAFSGPGRYLMSMLLRQARAGSREGSVVLGRGLALLFFFAASARVEAQCTLASTPVAFEPNPPGVIRVWSMEGSYSTSLALYQSGAGSNRMMMSESFGYSILDLSNPGNPVALLYDDFRFATTNPLQQHGDGQSAIQTFGVSPDGQRATFSVNGPFDPPWHTIGARNYGGEGFGLWGDFAPNRALGTVVQHVNGRYIAYAIHGSINMTAADITTLPSALAPYNSCTPGTSCQAFDSTGFPQAYSPPLLSRGELPRLRDGHVPEHVHHGHRRLEPGPRGQDHVGVQVGHDPVRDGQFLLLSDELHGRAGPRRFDEALDPRRESRGTGRQVAELRSRRGHEGRRRQPHRDPSPGPFQGPGGGRRDLGDRGERLVARRGERDAFRRDVGEAQPAVGANRLLCDHRLRVAGRGSVPGGDRPGLQPSGHACVGPRGQRRLRLPVLPDGTLRVCRPAHVHAVQRAGVFDPHGHEHERGRSPDLQRGHGLHR